MSDYQNYHHATHEELIRDDRQYAAQASARNFGPQFGYRPARPESNATLRAGEPTTAAERARFLDSIATDRLTEGEVDELARLDEQSSKYGRTPREI
jgi:hypothetical protein